jgi:RNA 3'-terminal phosphate cyclase (ATP)
MLTIDGSSGEGGGQILRTALALATVTGKPFRIEKIRASRERPGLLRQHLTAVKAAAEICGATVTGADLGSGALTFSPHEVRAGQFAFAVGTAGSATLVLQTVLPALLTALSPSTLIVEGGTHNPAAPPFDFLARSFIPLINRMGPTVAVELERPGFYPAGGGRIRVGVTPCRRLQALEILERGALRAIAVRAVVANLPRSIAQREAGLIGRLLSLSADAVAVDEVSAHGPGNVVMIAIEAEHHTEVFTEFGAVGIRAETVATKVAHQARSYIASGVPVGRYLADQLLVPMALAGAGRFRTGPLTRHTTTNIEVIRQFLEIGISCVEEPGRTWTIKIGDGVHRTVAGTN